MFFATRGFLVSWFGFLLLTPTYASERSKASAGLVVEDIFGRQVNQHGLILVDWEGYLANPAIKFFLTPPAHATFPARAILTAKEPRLYFNRPSQTGPQ